MNRFYISMNTRNILLLNTVTSQKCSVVAINVHTNSTLSLGIWHLNDWKMSSLDTRLSVTACEKTCVLKRGDTKLPSQLVCYGLLLRFTLGQMAEIHLQIYYPKYLVSAQSVLSLSLFWAFPLPLSHVS